MALNLDNVLVSGGDDGSMYFWDYKSGKKFQEIQSIPQPGSMDCEAGILCSAFDRSSYRLITGEVDKSIKIWREVADATKETHPN